jgi:hypothetical protein
MGKNSAPDPPDPVETSKAQTGTSVATALANAQLNNVNQIGPDGSKIFTNTGEYSFTDPFTNQTYKIPKTTETTTLSPAQQAIKDQLDQAKLGLNTLANTQTNFLQDYMGTPFEGGNDATEARLMELGRKRLDPIMARQDEALRTRLANQGIKAGSTAYDRELELQNQARNDANNQLLLTGHGQAFQEGQALRNQPINEITALMSGGQVSMPQFGNTNQGSIPTTDNAGLINTNFNQRMNIWQQEQANSQNLLGGLFGLGANLISDSRLKRDIIRLAKTAGGYFRYAFHYVWDALDAPYSVGA